METRTLTKFQSLYLDVIRISAALAVFVYHLTGMPSNQPIIQLIKNSYLGDYAVVVFFALSGYVIAYVTSEKERNLTQYAINRAARVYSVAIPAIVITLIADWLLGIQYSWGDIFTISATSIVFANNLWWQHIDLFNNAPYWSLSYEWWYYVLFGVAFYLRGYIRWVALLLVASLVGLKILLLLPTWLLGVLAYRLQNKITLSQWTASAIWLITALALITLFFTGFYQWCYSTLGHPIEELFNRGLDDSQNIVFYYAVGLLTAINIFTVKYISINPVPWLANSVSSAASYTFSIYLYQAPMLYMSMTWLYPHLGLAPSALVALLCCALLGQFTEKQKRIYRDFFTRVAARFQRRSRQDGCMWLRSD